MVSCCYLQPADVGAVGVVPLGRCRDEDEGHPDSPLALAPSTADVIAAAQSATVRDPLCTQ
jgi:hypothetical protein